MPEETAVNRPSQGIPTDARRKTVSASKKAKKNKRPGRTKILLAVEKTSGITRSRSIMKSGRPPRLSPSQLSVWKAFSKETFVSGNRAAIVFKPFARLCMEIVQRLARNNEPLRVQKDAIRALQEASENLLISVMQGAHLLAGHAGRQTIIKKDFQTLCSVAEIMQAPSNKVPCSMLDREPSYEKLPFSKQLSEHQHREEEG